MQLELQNLKLDAALKNMTQGLCMFDHGGSLVLCNEQYRRMYALSDADAALGTSFRELLRQRVERGTFSKGASPDEYLAGVRRELEKDSESVKVTELDDGRFIAVCNRMIPDGGWVSTHQDVTELRQAERSLTAARAAAEAAAKEARAAHSTLLDAFEVVPEGVVLFDADDRFVIWNKRYAELYTTKVRRGMRFEEMLRSEMKLGQYPHARGCEEQWIAERLARHHRPHSSEELQLTDGRWIRIHENRTANGGCIGVRIDITEHKLREEELKKQNMILDAALNNMSQGLVLFNAERRVVVCNKRYREIYALTPDQVRPGTSTADLIQHRLALGLQVPSDPTAYLRSRIEGPVMAANAFHTFADGRTIAYAVRPLADGGGVATHEDVTEQRRIEARIAHMAHHDALTDLPNRVLLRQQLEAALARSHPGTPVAVLWLDLDRFKDVNDTLGHAVGDGLLNRVADRLRSCIRGEDTVARIGGDEFAIIQNDVDQPLGATTLALRVIEEISAPYHVDGHQLLIGASVGISLYPSDAKDADQLLKNADLALYRAKSEGRGTYRFFEPQMDARMHARRKLELDLRQAISEGGFELHYQPIVDLTRNEVSTFEALLRWNHPERGQVSPAEFIPLAEETGLIAAIGEWVLRAACAEAANWPGQVRVAVNLSSLQFKQNDLVQLIFSALGAAGLAPSRLELEITESMLLENTERTMATLHRLRELGVRISMDDFGTGYSSLSNLRSFPFDKIKIDQSFVHGLGSDPHCSTIITAIIALGIGLGMTTTAEGVESDDELRRLTELGINEVQGYYLGRPAPASEVPASLARIARRKQIAA